MNRRTLAVVVLAAWGVALGWLLVRARNSEAGTAGEPQARRLAPEATYYQLWLGRARVGAATMALDTTALGYTLLESSVLVLEGPEGQPGEFRAARSGAYGRTFRLEAMEITGSDAGGAYPIRVEVLPEGEAWFRGASRDLRASLTLPRPEVTTAPTLALHLATRRGIRPGRRDSITVLDGGAATWHHGHVAVLGDSVILVSDSASRVGTGPWQAVAPQPTTAWRLEWRSGDASPVRAWVTDGGRVLQREWAFGIRQDAAPYEVSYLTLPAASPRVRPGTLLTGSRWVTPRPMEPPAASPVRVVLRRWDGPAWPGSVAPLGGGRQVVVGDTLTILADPVAEPRPSPLPTDYVSDLYPGERRLLEAMLAGALALPAAASDTLAALARAAGQQRGSAAAVRAFVGMAQLAGYAARPAHGIDVRSPGLPGHRWAEVWRGGWEAVDPARGHPRASTTLLRLGTGLLPGLETLVIAFGGLRLTEPP